MKKSEMYHLAQIAVVLTPSIAPESKVEILKMLMEDESLAQFVEKKEEIPNGQPL